MASKQQIVFHKPRVVGFIVVVTLVNSRFLAGIVSIHERHFSSSLWVVTIKRIFFQFHSTWYNHGQLTAFIFYPPLGHVIYPILGLALSDLLVSSSEL